MYSLQGESRETDTSGVLLRAGLKV